jgi:hypothetical protein
MGGMKGRRDLTSSALVFGMGLGSFNIGLIIASSNFVGRPRLHKLMSSIPQFYHGSTICQDTEAYLCKRETVKYICNQTVHCLQLDQHWALLMDLRQDDLDVRRGKYSIKDRI